MPPKVQFQFVNAGSVDPSSKESSRVRAKTVRAHAARNSTARVQRVLEYQRAQEQRAAHRLGVRNQLVVINDTFESEHDRDASKSLVRKTNPQGVLSASRMDPFDTFVSKIGPTENFLLDSYINDLMRRGIDTYISVPLPEKSSIFGLTRQHWLQTAARDDGIMCALLSAACQHINLATKSDRWSQHAMYYQARTVESLRVSLAAEGGDPSDASIIKAMALATEAVMTANGTLAKRHCAAAIIMFHMRDKTEESFAEHLACAAAWNGLDRTKVDHFFTTSSPTVGLVPMPPLATDADPSLVHLKFLMTQMKRLHHTNWREV